MSDGAALTSAKRPSRPGSMCAPVRALAASVRRGNTGTVSFSTLESVRTVSGTVDARLSSDVLFICTDLSNNGSRRAARVTHGPSGGPMTTVSPTPDRDYPQLLGERGLIEPVPRRVRGYFDRTLVFDTTSAHYVWEIAYYPQYYIP